MGREARFTLRLRRDLADRLNKRGGDALKIAEVARDLNVANVTAARWAYEPGGLTILDLDRLAALLVRIYGLSPEELLQLQLADLFQLTIPGRDS